MKTEIEDGVLIVKGFDARYCLVNGLTSLIILLCGICFYFLFPWSMGLGPKIWALGFSTVGFLLTVYLIIGYLFFEVRVSKQDINVKFLIWNWNSKNSKVKLKVYNLLRPSGWFLEFDIAGRKVSYPVSRKTDAITLVEEIKKYFHGELNVEFTVLNTDGQ